ncbi:MAG TPA: TRAP transporter small permease [Spirochaetales bacterium]|nr:TRAP transporter small permease [Spirochaetales bacterium]
MVRTLQKGYRKFCQVEELVASLLLLAITILVFVSAIARTMRYPLNWAVDISLLLFAWQVFIGGDIAVRNTNLIGVELLVNKFPGIVQKWLKIVFFVLIILFLGVLVYFGVPLLLDNWKRLFQVLPISYSWCTLSVPVGALLMMVSASIRLVEIIKKPVSFWEQGRRDE